MPIFILIAMPFRRLKAGWQFALAILCAILTFGYAAQHTRRLMSDDALLSPLDVVPEVNSKVLADWDKPERPRILYVYLLGYDLGRELDPLPVGRYWFSQNYIGNFHLAEQYRYIEERQPDYVFTIEPEKDAHFSPEYEFGRVKRLLKDSGYNLIYTSPVIGGTIHLLVFRKTDTFPFPPGK